MFHVTKSFCLQVLFGSGTFSLIIQLFICVAVRLLIGLVMDSCFIINNKPVKFRIKSSRRLMIAH